MNLTHQNLLIETSNSVERFGDFLDATDNFFWEWVEWKNRTKSKIPYKNWLYEKIQAEVPKNTEGVHIDIEYSDFEVLN